MKKTLREIIKITNDKMQKVESLGYISSFVAGSLTIATADCIAKGKIGYALFWGAAAIASIYNAKMNYDRNKSKIK